MLSWLIQTTLISIIFIFVVHYLINFFKSNLTVPKIKDLVNSPTQKYETMYNIISNNNNNNNNTNNNNNNNDKSDDDDDELIVEDIGSELSEDEYDYPLLENPLLENPLLENPLLENPLLEKVEQK